MKKIIAASAAMAVTAALIGTTAFAAQKYSAGDLRTFGGHLVGKAESSGSFDLNGGEDADAELSEMSISFENTGVFSEKTVYASEENVKYTGRTYYDKNNTVWLPLSGSAVEFVVNGKSAEITIKGDDGINNSRDYCPRYAVLVDGKVILDDQLEESEKTVTLFCGNEPRTASVKVIHLSESNHGAVGVANIKADTDAVTPVVPEFDKELSIEFIGDSITCGYGVEGEDQYEDFLTSTENFMKSYAYLTAQKLDADYSAVSYSGYGVVSGYTSSGEKNSDALILDNYDIVAEPYDYEKKWDHSKHEYDVIVINLGTNDSTYVSCSPDDRSAEFENSYAEFLDKLHKAHPQAYIICTLGTMSCYDLFPNIENAAKTFRQNTGYDRIMCYRSAPQKEEDGIGSDWHPSEVTQKKSADVLANKIKKALGI